MSATIRSSRLSGQELAARTRSFARLLLVHARAHWAAYAFAVAAWFLFSHNYRIGFNETPSLPQKLFVIHKNAPAGKGDYVSFRVPPAGGAAFGNPDAILTKVVVGVEGDVVTVVDRVVHVNGSPVGYAKTRSLKGEPLSPLAPGVIPFGFVYVAGLHKDSLDSRYDIVGLVPYTRIVGRAYPVF